MGETSEISWTDATFNPWIGCTKVSQGCVNCYAESFAKRYGKAEWGPTAQRVKTSVANWRKPIAWDRKAGQEGIRRRVFCSSLADVFEDNQQLPEWRTELFALIEQTPNLDWLLLTKRPENVNGMIPTTWNTFEKWPAHVWIGTSVEDQAAADKRIPKLVNIPAHVRFLSCEPLLGPVDLTGKSIDSVWIDPEYYKIDYGLRDVIDAEGWPIDWVIVGGESGPGARPMHPTWAQSLRDQCVAAGVAYHFKQRGEWTWDYPGLSMARHQKTYFDGVEFYRVGKHLAGRELDGRTWDEYPAVAV